MEIHLVDGTFELYRAFFSAPSRTSPDGLEVGAVSGLLRSLASLCTASPEAYVAVAFDRVIESFRNELFAGYKTGEGIDPVLWAQFPLAEQAARALGWVVWPMVSFEADDALATAAWRFAEDPAVDRVVICSPDKDLCQVVRGDRIVCLDRIRRRQRDEAGVIEKFGVAPDSIPAYLALVGDAADGIPGIPRWGARSSASVLARYGDLEGIPRDPGQWEVSVRGAATLARNLVDRWDDALLYRRLATLRRDVPLIETVTDLAWRGAPRAQLEAFCQSIGDAGFARRFSRWR